MLEHHIFIILGKLLLSFTVVVLAERNQPKPYYYVIEIILGSAVIASIPILGHAVMYAATAYLLRDYPDGLIRAWLWPVELYRSLVKCFTKRYPFRR